MATRTCAVYVLGTFHVTCHGKPVIDFRSHKVRALLAYVLLEGHPTYQRGELAALFWPELSEEAARRNLRLALHRLRRALGDDVIDRLLEVHRDMILCRPDSVWVDALAFEHHVQAASRHAHEPGELCHHCLAHLARAVALYRDDFLKGLAVKGSSAFVEWVILKRERWHNMAMTALFTLAEHWRRHGRLDYAHQYARRQIELEPWREEAYRQLMDILARQGQISTALALYRTCSRMLAREFNVEPDAQTQHLYRRILRLRQGQRFLPPTPTASFVGREEELAWLGRCLTNPRCRLITIVGFPGVGKTRLALEAASTYAFAFLHGVCVVSVRGIHHMDQFLAVLGEHLGSHVVGGLHGKSTCSTSSGSEKCSSCWTTLNTC
ncbi:MAG: BTAD domain-containing putative transcriptional regulator [Ardenticatenia bacterium]|nr:BTAD domain-containing putative transcriptional regulator [Ardenticatenia bacterium]